MGMWTYFSPLILGTLITAAVIWTSYAPLRVEPAAIRTLWSLAYAIPVGVACQFLMVAAQGAFAQVLPVPVGRSIRGRAATSAGVLMLATVVLGGTAALLFSEGLQTAFYAVGAGAVASLLVALVIYVWNLPAAARDFGGEG